MALISIIGIQKYVCYADSFGSSEEDITATLNSQQELIAGNDAIFEYTITNTTGKDLELTYFHVRWMNTSTYEEIEITEMKDSEGDAVDFELNNDNISVPIATGETKNYLICTKVPADWQLSECGLSVDILGYDSEAKGHSTMIWLMAEDLQPQINVVVTLSPKAEIMPGKAVDFEVELRNESKREVTIGNLESYYSESVSTSGEKIGVMLDANGKEVNTTLPIVLTKGEIRKFTLLMTVPEKWSTNHVISTICQVNEADNLQFFFGMWEETREIVEETDTDKIEQIASGLDVQRGELLDAVLDESERDSKQDIIIKLNSTNVQLNDISTPQIAKIKACAGAKNVIQVLDMTVVKVIENNEEPVTNLRKEVSITIDIPKEYQSNSRRFSIIRLHGDEVVELEDLDKNPNTITIKTDRFSLYTLVYEEIVVNETITEKTVLEATPKTGDLTMPNVVFGFMCASMLIIVVSLKKYK